MAKANNPDASLKKDMKAFDAASEGTRGGKSAGETATLRGGNLPKAEAVREVKCDEGAAVRCAQKQNTSDGGEYPKHRNVIPNKSDESLVVTAVAKVKE
jgi:hypothetical protein